MDAAWKVALPLLLGIAITACSNPPDDEPEAAEEIEAQMEHIFGVLDKNGDGAVLRDELVGVPMSFSNADTGEALTGEAAADAWFAMFDVNRDAEVTLPEYVAKGLELEAQSREGG